MANPRIEREPVCLVDGCPAPASPEWHVPWCGHGLAGHHRHVVKRSQGGVDGWVVFICPRCHDDIDNGYTLEDVVLDFPALNEQRYYIYRDAGSQREYLCEKVVYPPFWEGGDADEPQMSPGALSTVRQTSGRRNDEGNGLGDLDSPVPSRKALSGREPASPTTAAEDGADNGGVAKMANAAGLKPAVRKDVVGSNPTSATTLTFEAWGEKCRSIGSIRHSMGFLIGDLVILGEDTFGEKAWQYLSELGYEDRSIGNMVRVCRTIPPSRRNAALTYSHHVVVYKLPEAEQDMWLAKAKDMTVKDFREAVHGVKEPPVYRCPHCQYAGVIEEFRA